MLLFFFLFLPFLPISQTAELRHVIATSGRDQLQWITIQLEGDWGGDGRQTSAAIHQTIEVEETARRRRDANAGVGGDVAHREDGGCLDVQAGGSCRSTVGNTDGDGAR